MSRIFFPKKPIKLENDRGARTSIFFRKFLKVKDMNQYSIFTKTRASGAKNAVRAIRIVIKKPVSEKGNAD